MYQFFLAHPIYIYDLERIAMRSNHGWSTGEEPWLSVRCLSHLPKAKRGPWFNFWVIWDYGTRPIPDYFRPHWSKLVLIVPPCMFLHWWRHWWRWLRKISLWNLYYVFSKWIYTVNDECSFAILFPIIHPYIMTYGKTWKSCLDNMCWKEKKWLSGLANATLMDLVAGSYIGFLLYFKSSEC